MIGHETATLGHQYLKIGNKARPSASGSRISNGHHRIKTAKIDFEGDHVLRDPGEMSVQISLAVSSMSY
jgi:hypothetical protein